MAQSETARGVTALTCSFYTNYVLLYVDEMQIQHAFPERGVGRLTNKLPAIMMAKQLRIVQLNVRLEETGRRSTKERVNAKSTRGKLACLIAA